MGKQLTGVIITIIKFEELEKMEKNKEEKNLYHAWVEIDMPMKENETMEEAKQRMIDILRKTDIDYLFTHDESIRKCYTMKW